MSKVTGLKKEKSWGKRINVYLDGKLAIGVLPEVVLKENLKLGQEIGDKALEDLARTDLRQRCFNTAARFISYRPRSESEIRQRLLRHGFDADTVERTMAKLKDLGLADDAEFARFWIENREAFRPRSQRMAKMELKRKGLETDIIDQAVSIINDRESAYRAATDRVRRLSAIDYREFRRRLGEYLGRRGYNYGIIKEITERVWKEQQKK